MRSLLLFLLLMFIAVCAFAGYSIEVNQERQKQFLRENHCVLVKSYFGVETYRCDNGLEITE